MKGLTRKMLDSALDEIVIGQMPEWIPGTDHQDPHSRHLEEDVDRARG